MEKHRYFNESFECIMENLHSIKSSLQGDLNIRLHRENLNVDDAILFLNGNGYHISKSAIYKLTSTSAIPFHRFGNRLIFKVSEIKEWSKSKTFPNGNDKQSVIAVSKSALKKIYNEKN